MISEPNRRRLRYVAWTGGFWLTYCTAMSWVLFLMDRLEWEMLVVNPLHPLAVIVWGVGLITIFEKHSGETAD